MLYTVALLDKEREMVFLGALCNRAKNSSAVFTNEKGLFLTFQMKAS